MKVYINGKNKGEPRIVVDATFLHYVGDEKKNFMVKLPDGNVVKRNVLRDLVK